MELTTTNLTTGETTTSRIIPIEEGIEMLAEIHRNTPADDTIHKFEAAGLGKAPFRFVSVETKLYVPFPGAVPRAGSSCDYCSTAIAECCWIVSADGKRFKVGNECVKKTGDKGLVSETKKAVNKKRAEAKKVKDLARIAKAKSLFANSEAIQRAFTGKSHPSSHLAKQGKTFYDYAVWIFENAGIKGQLQICYLIEQFVK